MKIKDIILVSLEEENQNEEFIKDCQKESYSLGIRPLISSILEQSAQRKEALSDLLEMIGLGEIQVSDADFHLSLEELQKAKGDYQGSSCYETVRISLEHIIGLYTYFASVVGNEDCVTFFENSIQDQKKSIGLLKNQKDLEDLRS